MALSYDEAAIKFLEEYVTPFAPTLPDLPKQVLFPWDVFCKENPGMKDLFYRFLEEQNCELSEIQCSWACMMYRWRKLHPAQADCSPPAPPVSPGPSESE